MMGRLLSLLLLVPALSCAGCEKATGNRKRLDLALVSAARFLIDRQSADGAWRSEVYGNFKNGDALTPLALHALLLTHSQMANAAKDKGIAYLAAMVRPDGTIDAGPDGLTYPVYTAAIAVMGLSQAQHADSESVREAWLKYLRRQQLTEDWGWQPSDQEYGGWGYAKKEPRKPAPNTPTSPMTQPNLSATVFALEALRQAGCKPEDTAFAKARLFVEHCQNFAEKPDQREPAFDDGGFFFIHDDAVRNKAGVAGKNRAGRLRYFSYGSTTADGLRALRACGLPAKHERIVAARHWLEEHFSATEHPGAYVQDRESARPALYYYYCCSVAQAFQAAGIEEVGAGTGKRNWRKLLADALLERQRPDGSWSNPAVAVREDDPLVATPLAIIALATCRE